MITAELGLKCAAFVISLNCLILSARRRTFRSRHYMGYFMLCLDTLICSGVAFVSGILDRFIMQDGMLKLRFITETVYAFAHCAIGFFLFVYFLEVFDETPARKKKLIVFTAMPMLVLQVMILLNIRLHWIFSISPSGEYVHEDLWGLLLVVPVFHVIISLGYQIMYYRALEPSIQKIVLAGQLIAYGGVVLQNIAGWIKAEMFAESLTLLVLLLTLENADRFVDFETGTFNRSSLLSLIRCHLVKHQAFAVIDLRILSIQGTWDFMDRAAFNAFMRDIASALLKEISYRHLYSYGPGHFVILMNEVNKKEIQKVMDQVRHITDKVWEVNDIQCEVISGMAMFRYPQDVSSFDVLNTCLSMDDSLVIDSRHPRDSLANFLRFRRVALVEQSIDHARRHRSIDAALQPIYTIGEKEPKEYEAFMRLKDPVAGDIPPEELIPAAENTGCIEEVSLQLLDRCCELAYRYHFAERGVARIDVNLSNLQLLDEGMPDSYVKIVERWGMKPSFFGLEITEDSFTREHPEIYDVIDRLREAGFAIVLDNFGASSNNLMHMLNEKVDGIKIDRTVLWNAVEDEKRMEMLKALIRTMLDTGKKVCVTGVETPEQMDFARRCGCTAVQGWRLQAPMMERNLNSFMKWQERRGRDETAEEEAGI